MILKSRNFGLPSGLHPDHFGHLFARNMLSGCDLLSCEDLWRDSHFIGNPIFSKCSFSVFRIIISFTCVGA